jgi:hypothetical protein
MPNFLDGLFAASLFAANSALLGFDLSTVPAELPSSFKSKRKHTGLAHSGSEA